MLRYSHVVKVSAKRIKNLDLLLFDLIYGLEMLKKTRILGSLSPPLPPMILQGLNNILGRS